MSRIEKIKNHTELKPFIRNKCEENKIEAKFDSKIDVENDVVIIKVDDYYNSLNLKLTPAAADCLILLKCEELDYNLTIVELKNIKHKKRFSYKNIIEKFRTTIDDFMKKKFSNLFWKEYKEIKLIFCSKIHIRKRDDSLKKTLFSKPKNFIYFNNRILTIEPAKSPYEIEKC